ncbi:MAG: pyruvate formate-lyase [Clostridia bacterium]|nr:pyruvate formate-lyase [Clostridia bacterium]
MTDRISLMKLHYVNNKAHHVYRKGDIVDPSLYRIAGVPDHRRTALRMKAMLDAEIPVIENFERIVFTRTVSNAPRIFTDEEWADITANHYIHENGNVCNLCPDYSRVIKTGLVAVRDGLGDTEHDESARIEINAILDLTARYEKLAREKGMTDVADTLKQVPAYGARDLREALQSLRILHYCLWCEGDYHNTFGRFDQYMMPYVGDLSDDDALELVEEFFLACNRDSDLYPGMQQGDNGQALVTGGVDAEGNCVVNKLTRLTLQASANLRVIDPKINLRVDSKTPLELFELGTQLTKLGLGFPQYENDDVVIAGLLDKGYSLEDARNYVVAACWEFIIPGRGMDIPNIGALPIAGVVDKAIREKLAEGSMDAILTRAGELMAEKCAEMAAGVNNLYVIPSPYMSLFFDVEPGKDIADGCVYNNYGFHGTGVATAADSLAAVEKVVLSGEMSAEDFIAAMDDNFENTPELLHMLRNDCPKMGNDDDTVDKYGVKLLDLFGEAVKPLRNERGGVYRAGTGAAMYYIWHAADMGATADGRQKGTPLSANYAPSLNIKLDGPVSLLKSFAKPNFKNAINGGPLTIEFHDSVFRNEEAITKAATLVQAYIRWGGHQLQLNTVNSEVLKDAQAHPENYKNLIVRVWGWSGYFVELDKCYQDHIIKRVELSL